MADWTGAELEDMKRGPGNTQYVTQTVAATLGAIKLLADERLAADPGNQTLMDARDRAIACGSHAVNIPYSEGPPEVQAVPEQTHLDKVAAAFEAVFGWSSGPSEPSPENWGIVRNELGHGGMGGDI